MRASRLLSILLLLQNRGRMTAEALAAEFEVSVRTVYRDVEALSAAGVPVYADRGPGGGFELLEGYRTRLTGLTPAEASTLFLAGLPGPAAELGLADLMTTAQLKLTAALPEGARATAKRVAARFHLDPVGWFRGADDARFLPLIADAVWQEKVLQLRYRRYNGVVSRKVQPLGLVLKGGLWYLVAQVGDQPRTYRVGNIEALSLTAETFVRPKTFDLVGFWNTATRAYEVGIYRGTARLRVSPQGSMILERLGNAVVQAARESQGKPDHRGWVEITIPVESPERAAADLMTLGAEVEVLAPPELRQQMAATATAILLRHQAAPSPKGKSRPAGRRRP